LDRLAFILLIYFHVFSRLAEMELFLMTADATVGSEGSGSNHQTSHSRHTPHHDDDDDEDGECDKTRLLAEAAEAFAQAEAEQARKRVRQGTVAAA